MSHKASATTALILVTACFALWGFANDITNPMVKAFSKIFRMTVTEGSLVQVAFYGGYFCMALPAAMFIRRHSYKAGVMLGLGLYAVGALLFVPARDSGVYLPFLGAYFILTCGLSFLEVSANPYVLALGPRNTAIRRLNLAQAFNPIGSLAGMYVAMHFIQGRLNPADVAARSQMTVAQFESVKTHDLAILTEPYLAVGMVILTLLAAFALVPMPRRGGSPTGARGSVRRLLNNSSYVGGVVAQFFYVGAQIMMWTFIIQYGTEVFTAQGMEEQQAEVLSQKYNMAAMVGFCLSRFVCTWLMRYVSPRRLMALFAGLAIVLTVMLVLAGGVVGLWCMVGVSMCMSLMFPTIYGLALAHVAPDDTQIGAAGLIMAILGGSVLPPLQAAMIDQGCLFGLPAVNVSFVLPGLCFVVVLFYALHRFHREMAT